MRLLSHNLLICNAKNCDKNNFPLKIFVEKSKIIDTEFKGVNLYNNRSLFKNKFLN